MLPDNNGDNWDLDSRVDALKSLLIKLREKVKHNEQIFVLFICAGNICRSPYAEMKFEKMLSDAGCAGLVRVESGGFINNAVLHEFTRKGLLAVGVPEERLAMFHPRALRRQYKHLLDDADLIISPTKSIITTLLARKYYDKAFMLSEFEGRHQDIEDPATLQVYKPYKEILDKIDIHLETLLAVFQKEGMCNP